MDEGKDRDILYTYKSSLGHKPKFGVFNQEQTCFVVNTAQQLWFVDIKANKEFDIGEKEDVQNIQNVTISRDNTEFFILANKKGARLGYYLFVVAVADPQANKQPDSFSEYLIRWENKLEIADCKIQMLEDQDEDGKPIENVVVSYKCIGINTFNVFVFCLKTRLIKFWHESFQLWESPVEGFLLPSNDFLIISNQGINVIAIGDKGARTIEDAEGFKRKIHSLGSCDYLKIEPQ